MWRRSLAAALAFAAGASCMSPSPPRADPVPVSRKDPRMNLDDLLQRAATTPFEAYDPGAVIEAVNALVPLGTEDALAAIDAYLAKQDLAKDPQHGLFLVLRVAFEAEPHPPVLLGGSSPPPPADAAKAPRFPIAILDDVPVLLVSGYTLRGLPEPVSAHVAYYRAHGRLRAAPLAPPAGGDRLGAYEALYRAAYGTEPPERERAFVAGQLTKLVLAP